MTMFPQTERVPSVHLRAVTKAVKVLAQIKADPNVPERINVIARLAHARLDEYQLQLSLQESGRFPLLTLTSSERQAISLVAGLITRTEHHRDICITPEKKEALQQEIDALRTVLTLAQESI